MAIGLRLFELGARASTPRRLGAAALPVLAELFKATGEHINVAVQEGHDMLSVISVRGRLRPVTALGKAVLAFTADESTLRDIMIELDPPTRKTLERELAGVRASAVAVDRCETFPGVIGVIREREHRLAQGGGMSREPPADA